jgi:farnesyl diphosphate synthase
VTSSVTLLLDDGPFDTDLDVLLLYEPHPQALLAQAHAALATSGLADTRALAALADMVVNRSY